MRKRKFLISLFILSTFFSFSQTKNEYQTKGRTSSRRIYYREYGIELRNIILGDTNSIKTDSGTYQIVVFEMKGRSWLRFFDNSNKILMEGSFTNSLGLLSEYRLVHVYLENKDIFQVVNFYEPLKDGRWKVFDKKSMSDNLINYKKGVIVK